MAIQKPKKIPMFFMCESCDYNTSNKKDYIKHMVTSKHQNAIKCYTEATSQNPCTCGKNFRHSSSLYRHKKICVLPDDKTNDTKDEKAVDEPDHTIVSDPSLVSFLIKQNQEFKDMLVEQNKTIVDAIKQCSTITNNTNTVNSNNKTFNLQVFLNEDCKDAMNITDFVNSINFQLSDLEYMGEVGYVNGISNIIIKNLKALDVTKRPVHCTDPKRETIYIKDGGVWTKDEDNNKLRKMIKSVAFRNSKTTKLFKEKYPDCNQGDSKYSDIYNKIVIEAMGGGSKCNDRDSEDKIMRKIAKVMTIDKQRA
jgi:hypothetical protein